MVGSAGVPPAASGILPDASSGNESKSSLLENLSILYMNTPITLNAQKTARQDTGAPQDAGVPQYSRFIRMAILLGLVSCLGYSGTLRAEDAKASLSLSSPVSCQVFQRGKTNTAAILIEGTVSESADVIEAMADLAPGAKRGTPVKWVAITAKGQKVAGKFTGRLTLPAGGWYHLTVRAHTATRLLAEQSVDKVGVGEVFVTAGQSNSANFGNPQQMAKDERVVYFNGKAFVPAQDPIPGGCGGGGSPWALLGDRIAASQQVPVCFRSASLNWTEVKAWLPPDTELYKNLSSCVQVFGKDGLRAVLWHQGESDTLVRTSAETYCERIKTIVEALNKDAGYSLPWLVSQASFHPGSQAPAQAEVAKGQKLSWSKKICFQGPNTDDLLGAEYRHDGVHFNQKGLDKHAERWHDALSHAFKWNIAAGGTKSL